MTIRGFQITRKIHETSRSIAYRAARPADGRPVVLKVLNREYPTRHELARYEHEYGILSTLSSPDVVQAYNLEKSGHTVFLVLEDIGGDALDLHFRGQRPSIARLLDLAIQTSAALGYIHQRGIIHKDINPSNIVWNPDTDRLQLIDFGLATRLSRESPAFQPPTLLEGTLPYVSPEQTGRMSRHLDYRTDFYSLGVTLYELLTGRRPFEREDALELVHCHIAAQPRPPADLRPDTPPILSRIIMRLLAKTAEERYQSAWGLAADLKSCRQQLDAGPEIRDFPLGREDLSDRFAMPQTLYGREGETRALMEAFERVRQGRSEAAMVTGESGIGKSSLVRELYRPLTRSNAFFVAGKFDLLQHARPYSAIATTFAPLVKQLLAGTGSELRQWQERLQAALGPSARVLTDLLPELERVIGQQPEVEELGAAEARNRMLLAFRSFLRVLCQPEHPLVLFLDDLQWADPATLGLLQAVMADGELGYLLLIGAYRHNEVDATHPLSAMLGVLRDQQIPVSEIHLEPLALDGIAQLLSGTLRRPAASMGPLAELVLHKTQGNPFFIGEFLTTLHAEGLLRFDPSLPGWEWDMAEIEAARVTDNVAELLGARLSKLPGAVQRALRMAACMGNHFDLKIIAMLTGQPAADAHEALMAAVREGCIHPASEPELVVADGQAEKLLTREYRFVHDRVQQAAYGLIPPGERAAVHLDIGRTLLAKLSAEERKELLFELVDHLNLGSSLLDTLTGPERLTPRDLARLNLAAGQRAKEATAHAAAAGYLEKGIALAGDVWDEDYELAMSLHLEAAQMTHAQGLYERSRALIDAALRRARSAIDSARLYQIRIVQYTNEGRHHEAIQIGRDALRTLGHPLPGPDEVPAAVAADMAKLEGLLAHRPIASIAEIPEMSDPTCKAVAETLGALVAAVFQADEGLAQAVPVRLVLLALEHGHTTETPLGFSSIGAALAGACRDLQRADQFGDLALRLADRLNSASAKCKAGKGVTAHIYPWTKPLKELPALSTGLFEASLQSGELLWGSFLLVDRLTTQFALGMDLGRILEESASYLQFSQKIENVVATNTVVAIRSVAAHLRGATDCAGTFSLDSDAAFIARCPQESSFYALVVYYALKCQALYVLEQPGRALDVAREAESVKGYFHGSIPLAPFTLYSALSLTALLPEAAPEQRAEHLRLVEEHRERLRIWAESCPENFQHMEHLVAAEVARVTGEDFTAAQRYAQAIEAADRHGFPHELAVASELAARFWLSKGQPLYAKYHLRDAHYGYSRWGAERKVDMLERAHAQWLTRPRSGDTPARRSPTSSQPTSSSTVSTTEHLDLASVIKASQALSREITLDRLLAKLIGVVIENAGAQHGYLILKRKDRLVIEALGKAGQREVQVLQSLPLEPGDEDQPMLSVAVVNYVVRSRETVVLEDAALEGPFVRDPYVVATSPRSILCMPLLKQGEVEGVIYLENNLSARVFTPERVALLDILSSQMMISLENSLLYGNLQQASQELERLLYSIAHDLREPLRAILSFSELLLRRHGAQLDAKGRDYLERICRAGEHLRTLLEATRTIAEIRRADAALLPTPGEDLVREVLRRLRSTIEETGAAVRVAAELPQLTVDQRWAEEGLYQLVRNALQYTREGTRPEIDIASYAGAEGLGLVVQDRGPGIPEERAEHVFELFRRMVGREEPGTGAGLAIARQIAAKHGGNAWLRARRGGGTEAYITFGP